MKILELLEKAEKAAGEGFLRTARRLYEEGLQRFPEHLLFLNFNLGAMLQMQVGDGVGARSSYKQALAGRSKSSMFSKPSGLDEIEANIYENSMLLSLSFEEYEEWSSRLEKFQPRNPIIRQQRPGIRDMKKRGHAWYMAMISIAKSGYDAEPSKDPGRYAASASIFQLLLLNRRELRVPRNEHRFAVASYAALTVQAWSACGIAMEKVNRQGNFEEMNFVVEQAIPLVKEFVQSNPADREAAAALENMRNALSTSQSVQEVKGPVIVDNKALASVIQNLGSTDEETARRAYETVLRVGHLVTRIDLKTYAARNCEWERLAKRAFSDLLSEMATSGEYNAEEEAGQLQEMVFNGSKIPSIRVSAIEHILGLLEAGRLDKVTEGSQDFLSFVTEKTKDKGSSTVLRARRILQMP